MSTASGHTASSVERPQERSRNAKAQARHRAKRKAYIEQLEQTVTKLQAALGYSPEQVSALPPSSITIRELQQDNLRLQKEIEDLRRALADAGGGHRRGTLAPYPDPRGCDRGDYKRKKTSAYLDGVYMPGDSPHLNERPPPLTIPQPLSHHYGNIPSQNGSQNGPSSLFNLHGPAFQMPHTPSGSSATSSPPFSPVQIQSHVNGSQYSSSVKVEDDSYSSSAPHYSSSMHHSYSNQPHDMDWHYSSERAHVHR